MRAWLIGIALGASAVSAGAALFAHANVASRAETVGVAQGERARSPLSGRIEIAPDQQRSAIAAGLVDRPIKSMLDVPSRMTYGDFVWNDRGVPAGRVWVRVDLQAQMVSVFRAGDEIGTAVILYGGDGVPTPTGKFPILAKFKDHRSATYDGAPMPYTLRLTADGVSIHGSNVRWGFATHGCIGVPTAFAAKLFDAAALGDEVMIVSGAPKAVSGS